MQRVIQVGCGARGRVWSQLLMENPETELVAFMDVDEEAVNRYREKYPDVPGYTSLDEVLEKVEADFVVLVTPPMGHREQAFKIYDAGMDLLAEKPLALNMKDAVDIVLGARDQGRMLSVGLNFRYLPSSQTYRDWIVNQKLGDASYSIFQYSRNRDGYKPGRNRYPLTMPDGMLVEQSIHHFDLMRYCLDAEVVKVSARSWNPPFSIYQYDSVVSTIFEMDNGLFCTYLGSWTGGWDELKFQWRTDCADGIITQRELFGDLAYAKTKDSELTPIPIADEVPFVDDTRELLRRFVKARAGEMPQECSGLDHLLTLSLTLACKESHETDRTIRMDEFYRQHGVDQLLS